MDNFGFDAKVDLCRVQDSGADVHLLRLRLKEDSNFTCKPGQFVSLEPLSDVSETPRPFSVFDVKGDKVSLLVKPVGPNTKAYCDLEDGSTIKLYGPYGQPIKIQNRKYILVGGGVGRAALNLLFKTLIEDKNEVKMLLGSKKKKHLNDVVRYSDHNEYIQWTHDAEGHVTDLLLRELKEDNGQSHIVMCGPDAMMKAVTEMCLEYGNSCEAVLEAMMPCGGIGACKCCSVPLKDGSKFYVCSQGPTVDASLVDWGLLIPENSFVSKNFKMPFVDPVEMEVVLKGQLGKRLILKYPTMNGSGTLSIETLEKNYIDYDKLGAIVTKGVTCNPRIGNPCPRSCETSSGMMNTVGIANIGIDDFIKYELPRWIAFGKKYNKRVIVNISGNTLEEYVYVTKKLVGTGIDGIEVNISCPNLKKVAFGTDASLAHEITQAVTNIATGLFVIVKLTPNVTNIVEIAQAVTAGWADTISLVNTFLGMEIDVHSRYSKISADYAGVSGPAIRPQAVRMVNQLYEDDLRVPIIGMGGIDSADAAAQFFIAGANVIACGTGIFSNHALFTDVVNGVENIVREHGFSTIEQLTGSYIRR